MKPALQALVNAKLTKQIQRNVTAKTTASLSSSPASFMPVPVRPDGTHNSHSNTGNLSPLVDKMVGSSYDVVRECVYSLEYIKHVSAHLPQIYSVAKAITEGGSFIMTPAESVTPVNNGDMVFELTNNELLTIKVMGSDGVTRTAEIPLL